MKEQQPDLTEGYLYVRCTYCEEPTQLCYNLRTLQYLGYCPKCRTPQTIVPHKTSDLIPKPGKIGAPGPGKRKRRAV